MHDTGVSLDPGWLDKAWWRLGHGGVDFDPFDRTAIIKIVDNQLYVATTTSVDPLPDGSLMKTWLQDLIRMLNFILEHRPLPDLEGIFTCSARAADVVAVLPDVPVFSHCFQPAGEPLVVALPRAYAMFDHHDPVRLGAARRRRRGSRSGVRGRSGGGGSRGGADADAANAALAGGSNSSSAAHGSAALRRLLATELGSAGGAAAGSRRAELEAAVAAVLSTKLPKAVFRGALSGPSRAALVLAAHQLDPRGELLDIGTTLLPDGFPCLHDPAVWCESKHANGPREWAAAHNLSTVPRLTHAAQLRYRYVVVTDGVGCTDRLATARQHYFSGEVVLLWARSVHEEFWYQDLKPWEHYVPVAEDFSDLAARVKQLNVYPVLAARVAAGAALYGTQRLRTAAWLAYGDAALRSYAAAFMHHQVHVPRCMLQAGVRAVPGDSSVCPLRSASAAASAVAGVSQTRQAQLGH